MKQEMYPVNHLIQYSSIVHILELNRKNTDRPFKKYDT